MTKNELACEDLDRIARSYRFMPQGGAVLNVTPEGIVSNGMAVVARFSSSRAAKLALLAAGFTKLAWGWKLVR